jgi:hypothetical protein
MKIDIVGLIIYAVLLHYVLRLYAFSMSGIITSLGFSKDMDGYILYIILVYIVVYMIHYRKFLKDTIEKRL